MRTKLLGAASLLVLATTGLAQAEVPATTVDEASVSRSGNTLTVSGRATFANASSATLATDPSGDQTVAGLGTDLTGATLSHNPAAKQLIFTFNIADPHATLFTIPEVVHYHWLISVKNGDVETYYQLQAMRTGQYERTLPSADPLFRVNSCGALASGAPNCFEVAGYVPGTMANGQVQWKVPMGILGATKGSLIGPSAHGRIRIVGGVSAAAHGTPVFENVPFTSYMVGRSVKFSIVDKDIPDAVLDVALGSVGGDGTFVGKIDVPADLPDTYRLKVEACHGDVAGCGSTMLEIPAAT